MLFFTAPARRLLFSCAVAAGLLVAATGCRSTQSAYQFRPGPTVASAPQPTAPAQPLPAVAPVPVAVAATPGPLSPLPLQPLQPLQPLRRSTRPAALAVPSRLAQQLSSPVRKAYAAVARPARRGATDGAQATAEVGLGTTVLGVLGLIVGPISLIGLLIWGGPVWAILLGLSALAVLVAYLDPFR
ncbi:hypothetical protein [Hymenobacter psychrophilus]|uniref:Uncharacterized protein n=1 Tax=Hymenobacter psychrophilus TaxID=651662 RepID=A0A1H3JD01_9BACT|nr:hypothetical protein [Hymenobacter psychrophilus]SDY37801.1 hypothetical protein SAMN04488069_10822 [Hymenobacter psychrophilus]